MPRLTEWWRVLTARCRALLRPQHVHAEIDEELQFHIEMRMQEHVRRGMSEPEARRAAALSFGSMPVIKDLSYDIRGGGSIEALGRDVSYALRSIRKQRVLSTVVIGIVAIGIGANAAILGVADRVLWRELPVRAPGELEQIKPGDGLDGISYPLYRALRQDSGGFAGVVAALASDLYLRRRRRRRTTRRRAGVGQLFRRVGGAARRRQASLRCGRCRADERCGRRDQRSLLARAVRRVALGDR